VPLATAAKPGRKIIGEGETGTVDIRLIKVRLNVTRESSLFLDQVCDVFVRKLLLKSDELSMVKRAGNDEARALGDAVSGMNRTL